MLEESILIKNNADINKTVNNEDYTDRSLLYFCVEKKNIQLAKALIDQGCDVNKYTINKKTNYKSTPLYLATLNDNNELINVLLQSKEIKVDLPCEPISGSGDILSPLFLALFRNNTKAIESLLKAGADVNFRASYKIKYDDGLEISYSNWTPILVLSNSTEKANIIRLLIDYKADLTLAGRIAFSDNTHLENVTPLFMSIDKNDYACLKEIHGKITDLSKEKLININDSGKIEYTPLQYAVTREKISEDIINTLLDVESFKEKFYENGIEKTSGDLLLARSDLSESLKNRINDIDNEVKLFEAVENNDYMAIHSALENGKNPNVSKEKRTPLEISFYKAINNSGNEKTMEIIKDLVKHGANVNGQASNGETLLANIIKQTQDKGLNSANKDLIILLLESGADPKLPIEYNLPLIPFVSEKILDSNNFELLEFLLSEKIQNSKNIKNKPNINEIVNGGEYDGWNALSFAINNRNSSLAKFLIEKNVKGARVNNKNKSGRTWLGDNIVYATSSMLDENTESLITILFECGADPNLIIEDNLSLVPYVIEKIGHGSDFRLLDYLLSDEIQNNAKVQNKPNVNLIISEGEYKGLNPLCIAIKNDNEGLIDYLIKNGAKVDMRLKPNINTSYTPLGYACLMGKENCASSLLSNNASVNELQEILGAKKVSVLMAACSSLSWSTVRRILELAPNSIENKDSLERTAFMYVAEYNRDSLKANKLMRNLRGRKADINKKTASGDNALSLAVKNKQDVSIVMWLLENGVEYEKVLNLEELSNYKGTEFYDIAEKLNKNLSK